MKKVNYNREYKLKTDKSGAWTKKGQNDLGIRPFLVCVLILVLTVTAVISASDAYRVVLRPLSSLPQVAASGTEDDAYPADDRPTGGMMETLGASDDFRALTASSGTDMNMGVAGIPIIKPFAVEPEKEDESGLTREPVPARGDMSPKPYWDIYPALYAERPKEWVLREKTVFLTFDDGPSPYTAEALDVLKEKNIKATFFVVGASITNMGDQGIALLQRVRDEGHTLAIHCNFHEYKRIYASVDAFLYDFNAIYTFLDETVNVRPDIFRFPGGSRNSYNREVYTALLNEMERRGFTYYDWNASAGDSGGAATPDAAYLNATAKAGRADRVIVLMHDTKWVSVKALPRIIDRYAEQGYGFRELTNRDKPISL